MLTCDFTWTFKAFRSFECQIGISMKSDQTKQLLFIFKWQTLVVIGQDSNKLDVIVQCREVSCKFGCSGKNYLEAFNCRVQATKHVKSVKKLKETIRYLFLLFFLNSSYLVSLLPTETPTSRVGEELQGRT